MHPFLPSLNHIQYAFFWMFFGLAVAGNVLMVAAQYLIDLVSNIAGNVEKHMEKELHSPIHPPEGRAEEGVDDSVLPAYVPTGTLPPFTGFPPPVGDAGLLNHHLNAFANPPVIPFDC